MNLPQHEAPYNFVKVPRSLQTITQESETCFKKTEKSIAKRKTTASVPYIGADTNMSEVDSARCHVCFTNAPDAVFEECLHGGICTTCIVESIKNTQSCTICRTTNWSYLKLGKAKGKQVSVKSQYKLVRRS